MVLWSLAAAGASDSCAGGARLLPAVGSEAPPRTVSASVPPVHPLFRRRAPRDALRYLATVQRDSLSPRSLKRAAICPQVYRFARNARTSSAISAIASFVVSLLSAR